jgi:hypothetical protein
MTYTMSLSQMLYCNIIFRIRASLCDYTVTAFLIAFNIYCYESSLKIYYIDGGHLDLFSSLFLSRKSPCRCQSEIWTRNLPSDSHKRLPTINKNLNYIMMEWRRDTPSLPFVEVEVYTDKKENKIFLIYKEIQRDRVQSHKWLTASSCIVIYLRISSYIRKPSSCTCMTLYRSHLNFLILYMMKILFPFLSVYYVYMETSSEVVSPISRSRTVRIMTS